AGEARLLVAQDGRGSFAGRHKVGQGRPRLQLFGDPFTGHILKFLIASQLAAAVCSERCDGPLNPAPLGIMLSCRITTSTKWSSSVLRRRSSRRRFQPFFSTRWASASRRSCSWWV